MAGRRSRSSKGRRKVRYAVVGLGHIAQNAVLPAFAHAGRNSELAALVSDDPKKLRALGRRFRIDELYSYREYDACLTSGAVDAVYIALPNHMHREYTERAAAAGVHVLCEKPMALTEDDCEAMIRACERHRVKLMIAYRLHFQAANLESISILRSGRIGEPRVFDSLFGMQVRQGNIRLDREKGGGTLYDIGIYCINAARYLFRDEPVEVVAMSANNGEKRFAEVDEMTSAILRFPGDRLASFTSSFGSADVARYHVLGTKGEIQLDNAYEYEARMEQTLRVGDRTRRRRFPRSDQFAAELIHLSDCVRTGREPRPSGREGLADVRIIRAIVRSARERRPVRLAPFEVQPRPEPRQRIDRPPVRPPSTVHAQAPTRD